MLKGVLVGIVLLDDIRNIMFRPDLYKKMHVTRFMSMPPCPNRDRSADGGGDAHFRQDKRMEPSRSGEREIYRIRFQIKDIQFLSSRVASLL